MDMRNFWVNIVDRILTFSLVRVFWGVICAWVCLYNILCGHGFASGLCVLMFVNELCVFACVCVFVCVCVRACLKDTEKELISVELFWSRWLNTLSNAHRETPDGGREG